MYLSSVPRKYLVSRAWPILLLSVGFGSLSPGRAAGVVGEKPQGWEQLKSSGSRFEEVCCFRLPSFHPKL